MKEIIEEKVKGIPDNRKETFRKICLSCIESSPHLSVDEIKDMIIVIEVICKYGTEIDNGNIELRYTNIENSTGTYMIDVKKAT